MVNIFFKKAADDVQLPLYAYGKENDACFDLCAYEDVTIEPSCWEKVRTGISFAIEENYYGLLYIRSGISVKYGLSLINGVGVIDGSYRGEIIAYVLNNSDCEYQIMKGDRFVQMLISRTVDVNLIATNQLPDSKRGTSGFGSSG